MIGTMSTAVVCLELTGQLSLQLPILLATIAGYLAAQALNVTSLFDVFIRLKLLPGAALGTSHASRSSVRRGTSVQELGMFGTLHRIRLPRHVSHATLKAFLPRQKAFMQQTGVAFVPVVSSDGAEATFVGCVYFHLLEDVLNEFEELDAHRLAQEAPSARLAADRAASDGLSRGDANPAYPIHPTHPIHHPTGAGVAGGTEETLDLLWRGGVESEARGEPPREGAELAPLQISKHMRLPRVTFLFRMLGVSYACVTWIGLASGLVLAKGLALAIGLLG